jgi:gamma-glutamylputrescine oxidase
MQVSLWEKESFFAPQDVIIAGSGLMGLWTAYELKRAAPSLKITILEKNITPLGASTRNAGFACYGSPSELLYDAALNGTDAMLSVVEMRFKGIEKMRKIFTASQIEWDHCCGYEVYDDNNTLKNVEEKLPWLNDELKRLWKNDQTYQWANDKMHSMNVTGFKAMIENLDEAGLHSGKLVQHLMQLVMGMGVNILTNIELISWQENGNDISVHTNHQQFHTNKLLLATNAFTKNISPDSSIKAGRGQIIVTTPIEGLQLKGTFHYDEGFYYFRNVGNRILLGGARNSDFENEATNTLATSSHIQEILEQFISDHLLKNRSFGIDYRWSGIMGFTNSKQPEIVEISNKIHSVTACNGMGVALSPIFAEKVAAAILE